MVRYKTAEPSTLEAHIMEGSVSGGEPSTPKTKIVDGSRAAGRTVHDNAPFHGRFNIQKQTFHAEDRHRGRFRGAGRTVHVNAPFHGRFNIQRRTLHAEDRYRGWFDIKQRNRPHWRPISWMVRCQNQEIHEDQGRTNCGNNSSCVAPGENSKPS